MRNPMFMHFRNTRRVRDLLPKWAVAQLRNKWDTDPLFLDMTVMTNCGGVTVAYDIERGLLRAFVCAKKDPYNRKYAVGKLLRQLKSENDEAYADVSRSFRTTSKPSDGEVFRREVYEAAYALACDVGCRKGYKFADLRK